jgi:hypothetical protein
VSFDLTDRLRNAAVVALWVLGALGLGDFRLCFAAVGKCERPNVRANRPDTAEKE